MNIKLSNLGGLVGVLVSVFLANGCSPVVFTDAQVTLKVAPQSSQGYQAQALDPTYCYALNITGAYPALQSDPFVGATCPGGTGGVGLALGLYSVGDEAVVDLPSGGGIKFDLIAFPKNGSCQGAFNLVASAPGAFTGYVNGAAISTAPRLVATTVATILPGLNEITLAAVANESASLVGQSYTCGQAPTISQVTQNTPNTFLIQGAHLGGVTSVQLTGPSTINLTVASATANSLIATVAQNAQAFLGQAYSLVATNAYGQGSSQVFLTLAPASITPTHLDMTRMDWPFIPVKPIPASSLQIITSFTPYASTSIMSLSGTLAQLFDRSDSTGLVFAFNRNMTSYEESDWVGVIDLGNSQKQITSYLKANLSGITANGGYEIRCKFNTISQPGNNPPDFYTGQLLKANDYHSNETLSAVIELTSNNGTGRYLEFFCRGESNDGSPQVLTFNLNLTELRVYEADPF